MIKNLHRISGILLGLFIATHLVNHLMILKGEGAHIAFMQSFRKIYQHPVVEIILMASVLWQVVSGFQLVRKAWNQDNTIFDKLQRWSGLFFLYFLITHTSAVMIGRYVMNLDTNLYYGASPLNNNPLKFYFVLHYGGAIVSFFIHVGCAHYKRIKLHIRERPAAIQSWIIMRIGAIVCVLVLSGMMNVFIPNDYKYFPFGTY